MEVRPGYKRTEVGVIPEDWEIKTLGSILTKGRLGGNYANQDTEANFPLMKMGNLARGHFDLSKVQFIKPGVRPELSHKLNRGDVLFNTRNTLDLVGKVAIWRNEIPVAYYNSNLMKFEFDPEQVFSNEYANYALNTQGAVSRLRALATGTTSVAAIYTRDLMKLQVIVPLRPEQKAIATALSDVDALLAVLGRLIAKKCDLRTGARHRLLTGRIRLPGFATTWQEMRLGDFGHTYGGLTGKTKSDFGVGNARYVTFMGVVGAAIIKPAVFNSVKIRANERQNTVLKGDILFNGSSETPEEVALCAFVETNEQNLYLNSFCFGYRQNTIKKLDGRFLVHLLRSDVGRRLVKDLAQGSTRYNISKKSLMNVVINAPEKAEQEAIVGAISDFDSEIVALEARLAKVRDIKQTMMQALLSGRVRLSRSAVEIFKPEATHA